MKKTIITLVMLLSVQALYADVIYLNDGKIINGRIIRVTGKTIEYDPDGEIPFNIIKRESVLKIVYDNGLEVVITGADKKAEPEGSERSKRGYGKSDEGKEPGREFDEIHLNDGTVYRGTVKKMTPDFIEYIPEGKKLQDLLPKGQVRKLIYKDGKVVLFSSPDPGRKTPVNHNKKAKPAEGFHEHDGFFTRFIFGYGYGKGSVDNYIDGDIKFSDISDVTRLQVGLSIVSDFNLYLDLGFVSYTAPEVKLNGEKVKDTDTVYNSSQAGIGFSYYIMPDNLFIEFSYLLVGGVFEGDLIDTSDLSGTGIYASIGKEWWVSENWGLGVSLYYYREKLKRDNSHAIDKYEVKNHCWGLAFTATYN